MEMITIKSEDISRLSETAPEAGRVFDAGGLVIFPTETVYGIGASAASDKGYLALLQAKGREQAQPFTLHIPDPQSADRYVDAGNPRVGRLIEKVLPGPVTLVIDVPEDVMADRLNRMARELGADARTLGGRIYHHGTVGLRCPDDAVARRLLGATRSPVVASSANRRGGPPPQDVEAAVSAMGEAADLIVDGGRCRYARPSTIVRVRQTENGPVISVEREGVYDERTIRRMLRFTMLIVCSGNTCRSPMAEVIAKQIVAGQRNIGMDDLEASGVRILSAGAFTTNGMPAAREAIEAMGKLNIDLKPHRSRVLTPELIREADVIYCMAQSHLDAVLEIEPQAGNKAMLLDPNGDIDDPIGGNLTVYQRCAELIRRRLDVRIKEQQP